MTKHSNAKPAPAKGTRPEQGALTRDNDLSKTAQTQHVVESMVDGLNDHTIDGIEAFFASDFRWMGNAGCGTKSGVRAFQDNWQRPFQAAFSDKVCIAPTGKRVEIRYMDFWKVRDGKIVDNWVNVDFAHVMQQLGKDPFEGQGWEAFDRGERVPPRPVPGH
jgi:hypothetical protein